MSISKCVVKLRDDHGTEHRVVVFAESLASFIELMESFVKGVEQQAAESALKYGPECGAGRHPFAGLPGETILHLHGTHLSRPRVVGRSATTRRHHRIRRAWRLGIRSRTHRRTKLHLRPRNPRISIEVGPGAIACARLMRAEYERKLAPRHPSPAARSSFNSE
jgi:hypothetical protein